MSSAAPPRLGDDNPVLPVSPASSVAMGHALDGYHRSPASGPANAITSSQRQNHHLPLEPVGNGVAQGQEPEDSIDVSSNSDEPAKKKRRSRKGLGKRFECTAEGCGKSYSRAEHL